MASPDDDYHQPRKQHHHNHNHNHNQTKSKLKILVIIILTNLVTIYILTSPSLTSHSVFSPDTNLNLPIPESDYKSLLDELTTTRNELAESHSHTKHLHQKLTSSSSLVERLLEEITHLERNEPSKFSSTFDDLQGDLSNEAKLAVGPHKLPLGYAPRIGSDQVYSPVGGGCLKYKDDLEKYLSYEVGGECPVDDIFAQKLLLKGCEPLPKRRCHPKSPVGYVEPLPLPESLWSIPPDTSITWDAYPCKNYTCLVETKKFPGFYDCKDCFDLKGRESVRWLYDNGGLDYSIDQVLQTKTNPRTIRIGLDIGGGSGTFAARMKERNITIITTSMNFDGPFNSFIASRGLIPMHLNVFHRLPFFDNTLDIVHSMHVLSNWIPETVLEFTLYDIYRVLRPGGLFWLDRFFCLGSQMNATCVPMLHRVGFKWLRWSTGRKLDRGIDKNEWYFSAVLEKPKS